MGESREGGDKADKIHEGRKADPLKVEFGYPGKCATIEVPCRPGPGDVRDPIYITKSE